MKNNSQCKYQQPPEDRAKIDKSTSCGGAFVLVLDPIYQVTALKNMHWCHLCIFFYLAVCVCSSSS